MFTLIFHLPEEIKQLQQRWRGQRPHKEKKEPNRKNSVDNGLTADEKNKKDRMTAVFFSKLITLRAQICRKLTSKLHCKNPDILSEYGFCHPPFLLNKLGAHASCFIYSYMFFFLTLYCLKKMPNKCELLQHSYQPCNYFCMFHF